MSEGAAEPTATGEADDEQADAGDESGFVPGRRLRAWICAHPQIVTALLVGGIAVGQSVWIWTHRRLGAYDPDESSYLSAALRLHRSIDFLHPLAFPRAVAGTGNGIVTPLVSVPLLILGPRDPRTALLAQPLLLVLTALGISAITRRFAGPLAGILAGLLYAMAPATITATQSYWYGLGAAAMLVLAVWLLLRSDRGANRSVWGFGLALGAMLLTRTMTLGFAPALVAGALVLAGRDLRRLRRVALASLLGLAVAAPWYLLNWSAIFDYLLSYGYGKRARLFGNAALADRVELRWERITTGLGSPGALRLVLVGLVVGTAWGLWHLAAARRWPARWREALALGVIAGLGLAALVSTANNGVWFELPIVALLVPLGVAVAARSPRPVRPVLAVLILVPLGIGLAKSWWLVPFERDGPTTHYEYGFSQYDERFLPTRRSEQAAAARDWWNLSSRVEAALRRISPDARSAVFVLTGNTHLYNANSVRMAAELDAWDPIFWVPDTTRPAREREADLTPRPEIGGGRRAERVLVVALHDQILWTADAEVRSFYRQARRDGWAVTDRFEMPSGGEVQILRLRRSDAPD